MVLLSLFSCKNQQYVIRTIQSNDQEEQFEMQDFHDSEVANGITFNQHQNQQNQYVITSKNQTQSNKKLVTILLQKKRT